MGQQGSAQDQLSYSFNLDAHVPDDNLPRRLSIDPELMTIRMLIVGYCFGVRSERRLCEEVHLKLVYRLRLHPLTGDLNGFYSITVNGNWRVMFRFVELDAEFVDSVA